MQYLKLENVNKSYGDKTLFKDINLSISKGQKIALIAKNGNGKTTLLRVIAGEESAEGEKANILKAKDIKVAYLRQEPQFHSSSTILETVFDSENKAIQAVKEYEQALLFDQQDRLQKALAIMDDLKAWDMEARIKEILSKLGIEDLSQKVEALSGGQIKRLALGKILIDEPDFLILDEPTNHLDLDMIEWLEKYLQGPNITLFMVTHDRYFLERICSEIIELDKGLIFTYRGAYSDYLEKKANRVMNEAAVLDKTKKLYTKELQWIRRQPKARGTKAKSRVDNFYEIKEKAHATTSNEEIKIKLDTARMGSKILEVHAINKSFGEKTIIKSFSYKFRRGEKIGIVGPNGSGKTTFLKLITKTLRPDGGKIVVGDTIVFGYYKQAGLQLEHDKRVIDVIRDIAEYIPMAKGYKLTAEQLLERFLFSRPQQQVYVSQLSGGEKRRLYLLTVLMANPNFLILDEPTNDLDIITLNILEDYLANFPGCLIIVSHDRYFMDKLVEHIFVLEGDGEVRDFNGNYTEFREKQKEEERIKQNEARMMRAEKKPVPTPDEKSKASYEERKEFRRLEKEIEKLESRKEAITNSFSNIEISPQEIEKLSIELGEVKKQLEEKEERWFHLSEMM